MKKLLLFLFVIMFVSCTDNEVNNKELKEKNGVFYKQNSNKPFSGKVVEKNSDGLKTLKGHYKDGVKDGEWVVYYESGQKSQVSQYANGSLKSQKFFNNDGSERPILQKGIEGVWEQTRKLSYVRWSYEFRNGNYVAHYKKLKDGQVTSHEKWYGNYYIEGGNKIICNYKYGNGKYDTAKHKYTIVYMTDDKMTANVKLSNDGYKDTYFVKVSE